MAFVQEPLIIYGRGFVWIKTKKQTIFCVALQLTVVAKKMKTFLDAFFGTVEENKFMAQTKQIGTLTV